MPEGLVFDQPRGSDGLIPVNQKGRPTYRRVWLRREDTQQPASRPEGLLTDSQWAWAIGAPRRWSSVVGKFGDQAGRIALTLTLAGCIELDHSYLLGAVRQPPRGWRPAPQFVAEQATRRERQQRETDELHERAHALADLVADDWPGVSRALTGTHPSARLTWLVTAADDLAAGRVHDSLRAFVQVHAGHTKARDDLGSLLIDAGFEPAALSQLGISRSPHVGLGGPLRARIGAHVLDFTGIPGPHDLRLPPHQDVRVDVTAAAKTVLVIENRQAAEAICDHFPDLPVLWCHGQPPDAVLAVLGHIARQTTHVIICPDADLGGVRIAARIDGSLAPQITRIIVDIGTETAYAGTTFNQHSVTQLRQLAIREDDIGRFAAACLHRGFAIEQEAPARAALRGPLSTLGLSAAT